jgi:hypothetical protein
VELE